MVWGGAGVGCIASGQGSPGRGARSRTCLSVGTGRRQVLGWWAAGRQALLGAGFRWVDVEEVGGTRGLKTRVPDGEDRSTRV